MRKLYLALFIGCLSMPLSAQNMPLKGRIVEAESKAVIEGAVVIIVDSATMTKGQTLLTDSNGEFFITKCPSQFLVIVSHVGYTTHKAQFSISDIADNYLQIELEQSAVELGGITVTPDARLFRKSGRFVMDGISTSVLAKGKSTSDFIRYIPLLNMSDKDGISILGGGTSQIQIDGRSIGSGPAALAILKGIPADNVARIEIAPIVGSSQSASSKGGIVNIVLRKRPDEGVRVTVNLSGTQGNYDDENGRAFLSYATKKVNITSGFSVGTERSYVNTEERHDFLNSGLRNEGETTQKHKSFRGSGYFNLDYAINDKHTIGARISSGSTNHKSYDNSVTNYSRQSGGIDSVYMASSEFKIPGKIIPVRANLNYTYKTDDKGSKLKADIFYTYAPSDRRTRSIYTRDIGGISTTANDFIQHNRIFSNHYTLKSNYSHMFENESELETGIYLSYGRRDNDYLYSVSSGEVHVSDPNRSNRFFFKDYILAAFVSYDREWSDKWMTTAGVRAEKYLAKGHLKTSDGDVKRNEFDLFPSLSITYAPSENHELSLDLGITIFRPSYLDLNPFEKEVSPTVYIKNNLDLRSAKGYEAFFSYKFFKDFNIVVDYNYDKDISGEFYLPDGNGKTMILMDNYGDAHYVGFSFLYGKHLFNRRWYIRASVSAAYEREYGEIHGAILNSRDWSYDITINNEVVLSKKHELSLYVGYSYSSKSKGVALSLDASHGLNGSLTKQFKNSSLSLSIESGLGRNSVIYRNTSDYNYRIKRYQKPSYTLSYTHTFGNRRVKQVQSRVDSELQKRM